MRTIDVVVVLAALLIGVVLGHRCARQPDMEAELAAQAVVIDSLTAAAEKTREDALRATEAYEASAETARADIGRLRRTLAAFRPDTVLLSDTVTVETVVEVAVAVADACDAALAQADTTIASLWALVAVERERADTLDAYRTYLAEQLRNVPAPPSRLRWAVAGVVVGLAVGQVLR